jgi:hypothetical protein
MGAGYEIARAIEYLISQGHASATVWKMTPREMTGWISLAARRQIHERAVQLSIMSSAARADAKDLKKQLKEMEREGQ